jgi:uncharacterized membrane protein (GlpM family)
MFSDDQLIRLVVSFFAGAGIVVFVTTLADLYGEGPAGFIGGLPTAGAVSLLFIGLTQSTSAAVQATTLFPLGFSSTFAFLLFYAVPRNLRFRVRMPVAIGLWFPICVAVAAWAPDDFAFSVSVSIVVSLAVLLLRRSIATTRTELANSKLGAELTILRGALGGCVVTSVVILSIVSGPQVGGVFAAAPAIWSSSLYVTTRTRGMEFSRSLTWTFMQTGILTVIPYAVAARYFFSGFGVGLGTLFSYAAISPLAYLAWRLAGTDRIRADEVPGK